MRAAARSPIRWPAAGQFAKRRVVKVRVSDRAASRSWRAMPAVLLRVRSRRRRQRRTRSSSSPIGGPATRSGRGTVGETRSRCRSARSSTASTLAYRGIQVPIYVYTEREAELAALMPDKVAADTSKFLLCPMPGLVKAIQRRRGAGSEGGRCARRRRGHEDGEHPARRARRQSQEGQGQSRATASPSMPLSWSSPDVQTASLFPPARSSSRRSAIRAPSPMAAGCSSPARPASTTRR